MRSAVHFKVRTLLVLFIQVINKHLRINGSLNLGSLTEMPQHFERKKYQHKKKERDISKNCQFKIDIIVF